MTAPEARRQPKGVLKQINAMRSKKGTAASGPLPDDLLAAMSGASVSKKKGKK